MPTSEIMLYLSLLKLDRNYPRWRFLQPYELHQVLWKAFPDHDGKKKDNRVLYRHDVDAEQNQHSVLIQSVKRPDWTFLPNTGVEVGTKTFELGNILSGIQLRFLLRANPVVRRRGDYFPDGKPRHVLVGSHREWAAEQLKIEATDLSTREDQLIEWLANKGAGESGSGGFELVQQHQPDGSLRPACIVGPGKTYRIRHPRSPKVMTFVGVDFYGQLQVTDSKLFAKTIRAGIGRGKAFGFGLLSLAPAP